jgi:hypothetical protein
MGTYNAHAQSFQMVTSVMSADMPPHLTCIYNVAHDGRYDHDDHDYPSEIFPDYNDYGED